MSTHEPSGPPTQDTGAHSKDSSSTNEEFLLEETLFNVLEDLHRAVEEYVDFAGFNEEEPARYFDLLVHLTGLAEDLQLLGLADVTVRLSQSASSATNTDAISRVRGTLFEFTLAALDYLTDPHAIAFHDALIACVAPLSESEEEILRLMLGAVPSGFDSDSEGDVPPVPASEDSGSPVEALRDGLPLEQVAGEPAEPPNQANGPDPADVAIPAETQQVQSDVLALLAVEFTTVIEGLGDLIQHARSAEGEAERQEAIETCVEDLESLARGAEFAGLKALAVLLEVFAEQTAASIASQPDAVVAALQKLPSLVAAYLEAPRTRQTASELIHTLRQLRELDTAQAELLQAALVNVEVGAAASDSDDSRAVVATADDISLALPDDINPELLDGLLGELPVQTSAFASATHRISDGHGSREDIEVAKRAAHTLKGAANTVGVRGVATLTHHLEDILIALSEHDILPNLGLSQTLGYAADCLEGMSEAITGVGDPPGDAVKVLQDVLNWANRIDSQGIDVARGDSPQELMPTVPESGAAPARVGHEQQQPVAMMRVPAHLIDELLRLVGETMTSAAQIHNRLAQAVQQAREISDQNALFQKLVAELETLVDLRGVSFPGKHPSGAASTSEFDELELEHYNELQTLSRQLNEVATDSRQMGLAEEEHLTVLGELLNQQGRLHAETKEAVMTTRMVPVSSVVSRLQRSVRQACRILDKRVDLHVQGEDTVMDGNLLHDLIDPLMHLMRNAVDHGIEPEAERIEAGKSPVGRIDLLFRREGDYVTVRCKDDGMGLDLDAVRRVAEEKGIITPELQLTDDEVARLILVPGFSTREEATQVSGRGIGMDVVNSKVVAFKGSLTLQTERNMGLTVEIRLPVTLLAAHAVLVRVRNRVVALSTRGIEDIHYVRSDHIDHEDGEHTIKIGDKRYDIHEVEDLLGLPGERRTRERLMGCPVLIVRLETGVERAVAVQEVVETRGLVIKTLGPYVPKINGLIGATILGDGSVAAVVDVPDLLYAPAYMHGNINATDLVSSLDGATAGAQSLRKALVVDDSISARRFAAQIMRDAGYDVRTANDGLEAASILTQIMPDIVVTDLEMPGMNGFELTRHVRAQERTRHIPVIMITSRATEKHRQQAELAGVDLYFTKPFNEQLLLEQLNELTHSPELESAPSA